MKGRCNMGKTRARIIKGGKVKDNLIEKAERSLSATKDELLSGTEFLNPPYPIADLMGIVEISTILQQCVEAYKQNITGFGIEYRYRNIDENQDGESSEMKAQWTRLEDLVESFNFDNPFKDVFAEAIEDREICGNGYIEILRNNKGLVDGGEYVDPTYMRISKLGDPIEVSYKRNGKEIKRYKRFRKFVQDFGTTKIFFKEFGDPRVMDSTTGKYVVEGGVINPSNVANEILHLKIGKQAYGVPRWIGQMIHMYGSRMAEELNYRYFKQGRHTPMAIILSNGQLTEDSEATLSEYASSVEGTENAHKFLILEAEAMGDELGLGEEKPVKIELKSLADMLQSDALFLEYDEKSRKKVMSSFRLPPVYAGESTDYNRATVETARELAEEQIFVPERESLEFLINTKLFIEHDLPLVEAYFKSPDITDPTDRSRLLAILNQIGGLAPNDVRDEVGKLLGKDMKAFEDPIADIPLAFNKASSTGLNLGMNRNTFPIAKESTEALTNIMKDVRDLLEEIQNGQSN